MRISRPQMFMQMAQVVAQRSTCSRLNVGAVIVADRRVVSIGYNGVEPGAPHCAGNNCPGKHHCKLTTHAEHNALNYLPGEFRTGAEAQLPLDLYVTDSPCAHCTELLVNDGRVKRVFFANPYRINDHLGAAMHKVFFYRVTPAGYIYDWNTNELVEVET